MEEDNVQQLRRSSRSRSNTPFIRESRGRESVYEAGETKRGQVKGRQKTSSRQKSSVTTVSESRTNEVSYTTRRHTVKKTDSDRDSDSSVENVTEEEQKASRSSTDYQRGKRRTLINGATPRKGDEILAMAADKGREENLQKQRFQHYKTSDYSSEEGEGIAYQVYKQAGDWWNKFPKTDYTYSPISPHRKEVAPGVICMPNMSRRSLSTVHNRNSENMLSSSTVTKVTKHDVTKSRWFDHSTSGSRASKEIMENWAAVDSDVDDVDLVSSKISSKSSEHAHKSWTVTTVVTSFFITIWTFITRTYIRTVDTVCRLVGYPRHSNIYATPRRGVSPLRGEGSMSWLRRIFSWFYRLGCSVMQLDLLMLSSLRGTQEKQEHELFYEEEYYEETDAMSKSAMPRKRNIWRLLLLLLPLLFLAGWWGVSEVSELALNPLEEAASGIWNNIVGWIFIPVEAYSALKEKMFSSKESLQLPPVLVTAGGEDENQKQTIDMEYLTKYILASANFQQLLASHVHTEMEATRKEQGGLKSTLLEQDKLQLHNVELLKEHQILISQLTSNLQEMQKKITELDSEAGDIHSFKQDWELKWEKEQVALKADTTAQPLLQDDDYILLRKELRDVQGRLRLLQEQQSQMMRRCCQRGTGYAAVKDDVIEQQVLKVLANLLHANGGRFSGNPEDLRAWVSSMLVAQDDLEAKLANVTAKLHLHTREAVLRSREVILAAVSEHIQNEFVKWQEQQRQQEVRTTIRSNMEARSSNNNSGPGLTDRQVRAIVDEALAKYDADKTGLVDYALESSGGSIMSTRCTEAYQAKTASMTVLGIPLWYPSNNPRTVIQPGVHPGECWAFSGSQGFLVIKLSGLVEITGFSVEHIPRSLSPHGRIDSAPKDFTVWGLKELQDIEPVMFGKYIYRQNDTSLQYFSVQHGGIEPFELVELRIESNHGNIEYTCLYRFRVHGRLVSK